MMKKKLIVSFLIIAILTVLSSLSVHVYKTVAYSGNSIDLTDSNLATSLQQLVLYGDSRMHPEHSQLVFPDNMTEDKRNEISQQYKDILDSKSYLFDEVYYKFTNTQNGSVEDKLNINKKNKRFHLELTYDHNGTLHINKSEYYDLFTNQLIDGALENIDNDGDIKIDNPKNLKVEIQIPKEITDRKLLAQVSDLEAVLGFISMTLFCGSILIIIFMCFIPIEILKELNPYKTMKDWFFIVNAVIISLALGIAGSAMIAMIQGDLGNQVPIYFIKTNTQFNLNIALFTLFMIFYLFVSIIGFGLKYIVSEGVLNYFSEHTFIHLFYKYVKEKNEQLSEMAISEIEKKNLALTCFVSILFLSLLSFVPYIGIPLMVVYGVFLYFHLNNKLIDIKQHYQQLIDQTNRMIEGEFKEITEDLGSFNDLRDSLNKVKDGFEKAVDKEVSASKMKTELISNVSHDLKTPLTCIKNYVVLLQNTKDEQEREAYLKELNHYTNRMTQLIEDLFDVARVNSGEMNIKKTELDIVSLLNQALIESDEILSSKKLQIIKNSNVDKQMVMLDGEKTYRVFENLINNIGKYALDNTRVYIDLNVDEDITISFKNISKAEMNFTSEEIVERFKRGDKSRHQSGSGLGLAIAKSFTEVQEGKFDLTIDGDMFKVVLHFKK